MSKIDEMRKELIELVDSSAITESDWELWRNSIVTQKLMMSIEGEIVDTAFMHPVLIDDVERTALEAVRARAKIDALQSILDWSPTEGGEND